MFRRYINNSHGSVHRRRGLGWADLGDYMVSQCKQDDLIQHATVNKVQPLPCVLSFDMLVIPDLTSSAAPLKVAQKAGRLCHERRFAGVWLRHIWATTPALSFMRTLFSLAQVLRG